MGTIVPTNGRVMWYHPGIGEGIAHHDAATPLAAIVTHVWGPHMVNLTVFDSDGRAHARTSVSIVQDGSPWTAGAPPYAEWMPYQKGQAAKAEAVEAEVAMAKEAKARAAEAALTINEAAHGHD